MDALFILVAAIAALVWIDSANVPSWTDSRDHLADGQRGS